MAEVVGEIGVPPMIRQGQILEQMSIHLPDRVEGDWTTLVFTGRSLSMYAERETHVLRADGTWGTAFSPRNTADLLEELREVMYRPGTGTWFSAEWTLTMDAAGVVSADVAFNYDEEPVWDDPIHPGLYGLDLEDFPRDEEHIPGWLRARLAEAEAGAK